MKSTKSLLGVALVLGIGCVHGCSGGGAEAGTERGVCFPNGTCHSGLVCLSNYCVSASDNVVVTPLVISTKTRTPRTTSWSVNYWQWPDFGDDIPGTEALVGALKPTLLRIGGYNNDANVPEPFRTDALDTAVAYARAIGAEPILQVPLLFDDTGQPATPATAAALVSYANITQGYGIKYFSVGNEPDLYSTAGSPANPSEPAIPGYTPSDYCASVAPIVAAMKAVDPTIQIVGPDLSNKYQGSGDANWLTPILTECGELFDIIAIHRYPFEAKQATLAGAAADPVIFRNVIDSVRGILEVTGQGSKPLALTEMNIAYDGATCVLDAAPGTVGAALWLADSLGTAIELGLWTSAVWDISDGDDQALGLIGLPPSHTPRPAYYAYALYADHFGSTLLNVTSAPAGVRAHASRNQADNATEVIAINWNQAPAGLALQVTDLPSAPPSATFVLPPLSMVAIEIPDNGSATAWTYGETQRQTASPPQMLAAGATAPVASEGGVGSASAGAGAGKVVGSNCGAAPVCSKVVLPSPLITTGGTASATTLTFGESADLWESYTYAGTGQSPPTAAVSPDGNGMQIDAMFINPIKDNWEGVGLFFDGSSCIDASQYTGIEFDFSGGLGGCSISLGANFSADETALDDSARGSCPGSDSDCYPPESPVTIPATVTDAGDGGPRTIRVPFSSFSAGSPNSALDPSTIVTVQWQLSGPLNVTDGGTACSASFKVENVSFY